ncbi:TPA: MobV family relaxase, partial [Aeromonas veronii]
MSAPFSPANRVIARVAKHKKAHLHAVDSHNRRTKPIKNAVPGAYAGRIHGDPSKTLSQLVDERLAAVGMATGKGGGIRHDAVLVNQLVISASPAYFRPDEPERHGLYDQKRLDVWVEKNMAELKKRYGENLISVELHCDERTPHLHAEVVPLVKKIKKNRRSKADISNNVPAREYEAWSLDSKNMFGPEALTKLQDELADAVKDLGIERGVRGSRALHTELSWFHGMVERAAESCRTMRRDFVLNLKDAISSLSSKNDVIRKTEEMVRPIINENAALLKYNDYQRNTISNLQRQYNLVEQTL